MVRLDLVEVPICRILVISRRLLVALSVPLGHRTLSALGASCLIGAQVPVDGEAGRYDAWLACVPRNIQTQTCKGISSAVIGDVEAEHVYTIARQETPLGHNFGRSACAPTAGDPHLLNVFNKHLQHSNPDTAMRPVLVTFGTENESPKQ